MAGASRPRRAIVMAISLGLLLLGWGAAIAHAAVPEGKPAVPPGLTKVDGAAFGVVYSVPKARLRSYSSILIERIGVEYRPGERGMHRLDKAELSKLHFLSMASFRKHLTGDGKYRLVDRRKPGTLVVRAKLTDVWWPFRESDALGRTKAKDRYAVRMILKAELIDAETGETLVIASDSKGRPLYEMPTVVTSKDAWRETEKYFDFWASGLRRALDNARR